MGSARRIVLFVVGSSLLYILFLIFLLFLLLSFFLFLFLFLFLFFFFFFFFVLLLLLLSLLLLLLSLSLSLSWWWLLLIVGVVSNASSVHMIPPVLRTSLLLIKNVSGLLNRTRAPTLQQTETSVNWSNKNFSRAQRSSLSK